MRGIMFGIVIFLMFLLGWCMIPVDLFAEDQVDEQCFILVDYGGPPDGESNVSILSYFWIFDDQSVTGRGSLFIENVNDPAEENDLFCYSVSLFNGYTPGDAFDIWNFYSVHPVRYLYRNFSEDFERSTSFHMRC